MKASGWAWLQWVHGPRTVGVNGVRHRRVLLLLASMGPRSEDRGCAHTPADSPRWCRRFNGSTVRGPWVWTEPGHAVFRAHALQWVHGPRTVGVAGGGNGRNALILASMGPRSEDRGCGFSSPSG